MNEYDVIVIGVGSAGSRAAKTAHDLGARTLAIEGGEKMGGLCILRGCMPTKTLLETAHRAHDARDGSRFGIEVDGVRIDFAKQMERMRSLVARFQRAKASSIENGGYELRRGRPHFVDPHTIELDGETIRAKAFVLSTGSKVAPFPVELPDGARIHDSDDMFLLEAAPKSALVFGAGAVGLEFAQWLARMGTHVTLSNRSPLLRKSDPEMGAELARALAAEMDVALPAKIRSVKRNAGESYHVALDVDGEAREIDVEMILNATGRIPNFDGLEVEACGLETNEWGSWDVTDEFQSNVDHVFIAGDASSRNQILHEANIEGTIAGRNAARIAGVHGGELESWDNTYPAVFAMFTDPVFATVGCTPVSCAADGREFKIAKKAFPQQGRGIVVGAEYGYMQLLSDPKTRKIVGCQILGPRADDLIHIPTTVISMGGTVDDMARLPWYHPTLAEAFIEVVRELAN